MDDPVHNGRPCCYLLIWIIIMLDTLFLLIDLTMLTVDW